MALPAYYTTGQRVWHRTYVVYCALVLFFLVMPLIAVIPLSFTAAPFLDFTPGMLRLDPEAFSVRWYKLMVGDCSAADVITTVCSDKWKIGAVNSLIIAVVATVLATAIGTLAALGLSRSHLAGRRLIMAFLISPMIVPLIITAAGMFLFYAKLKLVASFAGVILAHTVLGLPFVVITVTATLIGFDYSLTRAAQSLGGSPTYNFFKVQLPLIAPGVISGALFAFITSFDEVVIIPVPGRGGSAHPAETDVGGHSPGDQSDDPRGGYGAGDPLRPAADHRRAAAPALRAAARPDPGVGTSAGASSGSCPNDAASRLGLAGRAGGPESTREHPARLRFPGGAAPAPEPASRCMGVALPQCSPRPPRHATPILSRRGSASGSRSRP